MKRLMILGIIACVGLLVGSAAVIGDPAGPPGGLDVNVVSPDPLPVTGTVDATVTGDVDVNVVNPIPLPVTGTVDVSTVYRFVGVTTEPTDGDGGGYIGMNDKCQAYLGNARARMCTSEEFFLTGVGTPLGGPAAWISASLLSFSVEPDPETIGLWRYTIVIDKGQIYQTISNTPDIYDSAPCTSWSDDDSGELGWVITTDGRVGFTSCNDTLPVACCAPANQTP